MPEKKEKTKKDRKILKWALSTLLSLLLMGLVYCAAVLLQGPADAREGSFVVEEEKEPVTRMQPAKMNDAQALADLFGAPLPTLPGQSAEGEGANAVHDGETARVATLRYGDTVITAVRPASAAPLLLRSGLSVSLRTDITALNMPVMLTGRDRIFCAFMTGEDAAYSVYVPDATENDFVSLLSRLAWALPSRP